MTIMPMSHDQKVFHAMLGKNYSKFASLKLNCKSPCFLVYLIKDMGLTIFFSSDDLRVDLDIHLHSCN